MNAVATTATDFRPVHCVLGLPFDVVDLEQASKKVETYGGAPGAILSTPNVNWVMLARQHDWLRDSVLRSTLSVVDGMPLVWLGRLTGAHFPERVSGSDLFNRLNAARRPLRVFFFGGQADVAERASHALSASGTALSGCGGLNPGSGALTSMSTPDMIEPIRESRPDLVLVSLGALRGQAWIMANRGALGAPWVTHLGAVVNFVAGEIERAPQWIGRIGLEWVWRIVEEPKLWKRYFKDGLELIQLTGRHVLPLLFWQRLYGGDSSRPGWRVERAETPCALSLSGAWRDSDAHTLHEILDGLLAGRLTSAPLTGMAARIDVDLSGLRYLSSGIVGQLLVWHGRALESGGGLRIVRPSFRARRLLSGYAVEYLYGKA